MRNNPLRPRRTPLLLHAAAALLGAMVCAQGQAAERQHLHGHVPKVVPALSPVGTLDSRQRLDLAIALPLRNPAGLSALIGQLYDPASPLYRHYLTPAQFTAQFGPAPQDYEAVAAFAKAHGLEVTHRHPNRLLLDVAGSVADIQNALHTTLRVYRHPAGSRTFYAPDVEPSLDLATPIAHIEGLDDFSPPEPRVHRVRRLAANGPAAASASPNTGTGPSGTYMGSDFRNAYVPGVALTGSGQKVALLEFDGYTAGDIAYYEQQAGLPSVSMTNVLLDDFNGRPTHTNGPVEVSLDIEVAISMAPGMAQLLVYEAGEQGSWHDILNRMATDDLAKNLSCSWYIPSGTEDSVADGIFQEMSAQGQSFFSASGDSDAYTGLIPFPGDSPYITQVGGTTLTDSGTGGSWSSETVWNWGNGEGSSGGISTQYPIPSWQEGVSMAANQGSTTMRNTPDVALTADNIQVRVNGQNEDVGGTSCAAPLWAAFTALVNQQAAANGRSAVGFINPAVYAIAESSLYNTAFHDIATGNNTSTSSPSKFYAVTGYDLCTGIGTPAGAALIDALAASNEYLAISPLTGFAPTGPVGGAFSPASAVSTLTNTGSDAITWTASATQPWLALSATAGTLAASGSVAVTASINGDGNTLSSGTYTDTITFADAGTGDTQTRPVILTVVAAPVITSSLAATGTAGAAFSYQITASNSPSAYAASGLPLGLSVNASSGLITGTATTAGNNSVTISAINTGGTGTAILALTVLPQAPVITSATSAIVANGAAFSYSITASNSPSGFAASGLPAGLTVNPSSGLISGSTAATGIADATISAINSGGTGSAILAIQVLPPLPVISSALGVTATAGIAFSYQIGASNSPTSYSASGLPSNLGLNTATGLITGTVTATGTSDVALGAINAGGTGSAILTISTVPQPPVITSATSALVANGAAFAYTITASNSPTGFTATGLPAGLAVNSSSGLISGSTTATGTTASIISAMNASGTGSATLSIVVLPPVPIITSTLAATTVSGQAFTYQITASNSPASYSASGLPSGLKVNTASGLISGTTTATGASNITISAVNLGGTGSATLALTVLPPPPVITSAASATGAQGVAFSYTITASNSPGSFNATGLPSGLSVSPSTGVISGTPAATGTTAAIISAVNATGTGSASLSIVISPPPPVITSALTATGTAGSAFTYQITAINNPTSFAATNLPPGLAVAESMQFFPAGTIYGTLASAGTTTVIISAINGSGTGSAALVITSLPPPAPVITSATNITATQGLPFTYQITANNLPGSYSATGLPGSLTVSSSTGLISGTWTASGTSSFVIAASNTAGSGTATVDITVQTPYQAWESEMFASSNLAEPSISGDTADPAGDGIPNLMKYALNLNPFEQSVSGLPVESVITTGSGNFLALTYTQVISATDITYTVQVSTDMVNWFSGAGYTDAPVAVDNADGVTQTVTVQTAAPISGTTPQQFIRLQVTGP
ncbi:MAG TPA: putative Ig domain-containing protein [Chthoniobacteraceae bacterium]|jgi:subtilase family serine protease|nr:putative Ig domain-containing protein [Chthoniobacteraceae bacterium]